MKTWAEFNVNEMVRVKLTPVGLAELKRKGDELRSRFPSVGAWTPPKTDADGWSEFQLWSLMRDLGHLCGCGSPPPFETSMQFERPAVNGEGK